MFIGLQDVKYIKHEYIFMLICPCDIIHGSIVLLVQKPIYFSRFRQYDFDIYKYMFIVVVVAVSKYPTNTTC